MFNQSIISNKFDLNLSTTLSSYFLKTRSLLSVYLFIHSSICTFVFCPSDFSLPICLSIQLFRCLSVCPSINPYDYMSIRLSIHLPSVQLSVCPTIQQSAYLCSMCLPLCQSICLFIHPSAYLYCVLGLPL
jgi:hypothetical protein